MSKSIVTRPIFHTLVFALCAELFLGGCATTKNAASRDAIANLKTAHLAFIDEFTEGAGKIWDDSADPGRKAAVAHGNVFYTIPGAELDQWMKASAGLYDEWVSNMDKMGLPGKQMLADAKELLVKYKK